MATTKKQQWNALYAVLVILASTTSCTMLNLQRNISELDRSIILAGRVVAPAEEPGNVLVLLYKQTPRGTVLVDSQQVNSDGYYLFLAARGHQYYLTAFSDRNGNTHYEPEEPAGYYYKPPDGRQTDGQPTPVSESMDDRGDGATIVLSADTPYPQGFPVNLKANAVLGNNDIPLIFGDVISLDDPKLSREVADKGLWAPLDFARQNGVGIYFLEEYDPQKIPVLFVHGLGGTPLDFELFLKDLDRSRYQPWLFYYPTGVRLYKSERLLTAVLDHFKQKYGFSRLYIVAHSMGGLLARSYIVNTLSRETPSPVKLLITFSTPWNGHNAAARGVSNSPIVMPAWIDIQPDSGFIKSLFTVDIASHLDYYLFFSFNNNKNGSGVDNDGTVTLTSQLDRRAQQQAKRLFGVNASHRKILRDEAVIASFNTILSDTTTAATAAHCSGTVTATTKGED
jgi:pimeloyl-ACP methyl ester carboxylesterase